MPSAAKKRKAAKRRKEKQANNLAIQSHGDNDLKVHDEKESDGGESGSPASQGHHNHRQAFAEGDENTEKREDPSTLRSIAPEAEIITGINGDEDIIKKMMMDANSKIQIDRGLNSENDFERKNLPTECVEYVKESNCAQMSLDFGSSSSSSSDNESRVAEKNRGLEESKLNAADLVMGCTVLDDSEHPDNLREITTDGVPPMEAYNSAVGEQKDEACHPSVDLGKPADFPEELQVKDGISGAEAYCFKAGITPLVSSDNLSKEAVRIDDSSRVITDVNSKNFEAEMKENGENKGSGVLPVVMDMASQQKKDKVSSTADENSAVSSGEMGFAAQEHEHKMLKHSSVPSVYSSNGAEHIKDYAGSEFSDKPSIASAPRHVHMTSWRSCCGLFELFTGSN
ncbi:hypothetical protein NMG60_11015074 [Bertholletia excelsa]